MLKRRLRYPIFEAPQHCMQCDDLMDIYVDHALVCSAAGDRVSRHNLLRNKAFYVCQAAGLQPQLEKPGLLDNSSLNSRRPADIFIPNLKIGQQTVLDFGVTSGMRGDILEHSSNNNRFATEEYAHLKRNSSNTHEDCLLRDIRLIRIIVEASGGAWGLDAEDVWKTIIKSTAALTGEPISSIAND